MDSNQQTPNQSTTTSSQTITQQSTKHHPACENIPGFVYIENFLTEEESNRVLSIIDSHQWSKEIVRRQQFYGPVFYFTPRALLSTLQPISSGVLGELYTDDQTTNIQQDKHDEAQQHDEQKSNDNLQGQLDDDVTISSNINHQLETEQQLITQPQPESQTNEIETSDVTTTSNNDNPTSTNTHQTTNEPSQYPDQQTDLYAHSIEPLNWLIQKLIDNGLFERADVRDPFAEYELLSNSRLNRVSNPNMSDLNNISETESNMTTSTSTTTPIVNSDPRSELELDRAIYKDMSNINEWGDADVYPDQILVNEYLSQMGIGAHFDDALSFGPQIIGISLGNECTLTLSRPLCCSLAHKELTQDSYHVNDIEDCFDDIKDCINDNNNTHNTNTQQQQQHHHQHQKKQQQQQHKKQSTSHNISLRDYSRPSWKVGDGPKILSKYCRCTRQNMLYQYHPNAKHLVHLPILLPIDYQQTSNTNTTPNNNDSTDTTAINNDTNTNPTNITNNTTTNNNTPTAPSNTINIQERKRTNHWAIKRQAVLDEFIAHNNSYIPQTEEDINNFILNYNFSTLPHRQFHPRGGDDITPQSILDQMPILSQQTQSTLDFTPTLEEFNRCKYPAESYQFQLKPGSVYVMSGMSRYQFRHAIPKGSTTTNATTTTSGNENDYRRVSLTIRSLLPGRRQVAADTKFDNTKSKRTFYGIQSDVKKNQNKEKSNNNNESSIEKSSDSSQSKKFTKQHSIDDQ